MPTIIATFVNPPIPIRCLDWSAVFSDYEPGDLQGFGTTREEAVDDLICREYVAERFGKKEEKS